MGPVSAPQPPNHSLDSQQSILEDWAASESWEVVGYYVDSDASAYRTDPTAPTQVPRSSGAAY